MATPITRGARSRGSTAGAAAPDGEARVNAFFSDYLDAGADGFLRHVLRRAPEAARVVLAAQRLPEVVVRDGADGEGPLVTQDLTGSRVGLLSIRGVLTLPSTPAEVSLGASKQTLRRKCRAAEKAGVTWRRVDDPAERGALLEQAERYEREHPRAAYRGDPDGDDARFLPVRLWLAAFAGDGRPVVLAVLPVHGDVAALSLFRALEDSDEASNGRYPLTRAAGEELVRRGVVHLIDVVHPVKLKNGLRHFQRMNGFRLRRVRTA